MAPRRAPSLARVAGAVAVVISMAVVCVPVQESEAFAAASAGESNHLSAATAPDVAVGPEGAVTDQALQTSGEQAVAEWAAAAPEADVAGITFAIADLAGLEVGEADDRTVTVDIDAAGWGWSTAFPAEPSMHLDLMSTLRHEVGHVLGLAHGDSGLMAGSIGPGEVRTISADDAAAAQPLPAPPGDTTTEASSTEPATDPTPSAIDADGSADGSTDPADDGPEATETTTSGWSVDGAVATFSVADGPLDGTLRYDATEGTLVLEGADGTSDSVSTHGVTSVVITGSAADDTLAIDASVAGRELGISFDGAEGDDTLAGPASDQTWAVDGPGSGAVAGVTFSGVERLRGGDDNHDTFVFGSTGSIAGSVQGGAGGFDTLVFEGGSFANVAFTASAPDAGTVARDGDLLTYAGFEPVTFNASAATLTVTATGTGADTIIIRDSGAAGDGKMEVFLSAGELHSIEAAGSIDELIVDGGVGDDTITLQSVDSAFQGRITIKGGEGTDTFVAPDVAATWTITGIDSGTYDASGQPKVSFESVGGITGAATEADSFEFESGSGLTGEVDDGDGTLTVSVAGFVKVSGDLDFVRQIDVDLTKATTDVPGGEAVTGTVLGVGGSGGAGTSGFVGVEPLNSPIGVEGELGSFAVGVITDGTDAWHVASGTLTDPSAVGFGGELTIGIPSAAIKVNDAADDGSWLKFDTTPVIIAGTTFGGEYASTLLAVTVTASITVGDVVHIGGSVTLARGGVVLVDVATGLTGDEAEAPGDATYLEDIPTTADDPDNDLWRETDYSVIHNVRVTTLQISANDVNVFLGWNMGWTDTDGDDEIDEDELGADAVGFFAEDIDVGFVLASAGKTGIAQLDAKKLKFMALKATAAVFEVVGIPEIGIEARDIAVEVNRGTKWSPTGNGMAVIDWAASFPDGADDGEDADGFSVVTGGDPVQIDYEGVAFIGVSADRTLLRISDAVHLSGSFSFRFGEITYVDVVTGLTTPGTISSIPVSGVADTADDSDTWENDPGGNILARSTDGGIIYNVPVSTLLIGASGVSVFFGWAPGLSGWSLKDDDDGVLSRAELDELTGDDPTTVDENEGDRMGVFVSGLDLGMAFLNPSLPSNPALQAALPRLFAMDSLAADAGWVGFEETFELSFRDVSLEMNRGTPWFPTSPTSPIPVVDWQRSFGPEGLAVPTGTTTEPFHIALEGTSFIGISANQSLLQISDAVLVTGAFNIRIGEIQYVDVVTGFTAGLPTQLSALGAFPAFTTGVDADPGGTTLARAEDWSMIYNVPVNTFQFGMTDASAFFGWAPGLSAFSLVPADFDGDGLDTDTDIDGYLDRAELDHLTGDIAGTPQNEGARTGLFLSNLRLGLMTMAPAGGAGSSINSISQLFPKMFAFDSFAEDAGWVGFEDQFELTARRVRVRANQGTVWSGVPPGAGSTPYVDFMQSFPDTDGFAVRTGSTEDESEPVTLDFEDALIGVSADRMLLQISDAVLITGGFSLLLGPVEHVDVVTGLNGAPSPGPVLNWLNTILPSTAEDVNGDGWADDPGGDLLRRSGDYGIIYNLPVRTMQLGITDASVFLGWASGLSGFSLATDVDFDGDGDIDAQDMNGYLDRAELDFLSGDDPATTDINEGDRIGLLVSGLRLGLVLADPVPYGGAQAIHNAVLPHFLALSSFASDAGWVGFEEQFELTLRNVAVEVNRGTSLLGVLPTIPNPTIDWVRSFGADGYEVATGTTEDSEPVFLTFEGTPLVGFSADKVLLQISDAVLITGGFSFRIGPVRLVDVATGLLSPSPLVGPLAPLNAIPTSTTLVGSEDTDMWRTDDFSTIHNLRVNTIELGANDVSVFLGWAPGLGAFSLDHGVGADGVLSRADFDALTGDDAATPVYDGDAVGFFVETLDLGMLLMNPVPLTGTEFAGANLVNPLLPRLFALNSIATSASWVGFNEHFELEVRNIAVEINQGTPWRGALPGTPNPAVDWEHSFPDTDGDGTDDAAGYEVRTGSTDASPPMLLAFEGTPLIGVSADNVILQISDAVLLTGAFSFRIGPVRLVDVATGIVGSGILATPAALNSIPTEDLVGDPETDMWRADDFSMIHNLRVNTIEFGASSVSAFVGWAPGLGEYDLDHDLAADGVLSRDDFNTLTGDDPDTSGYDGDAIGVFLENLRLGLLLMNPVPLTGPTAAVLNPVLPRLFAVSSFADSAAWVGFNDTIELEIRNIGVEINQGTPWVGVAPGTPNPAVDWKQSFPDSDDDGPDVDGYEVRTGTTEAAAPVLLDFDGTPLIGFSADKVIMQISDAVLITGGFSFRIGPVQLVDVATGLVSEGPLAVGPVALNFVPTEDMLTAAGGDPDTDMWRADDYSMLHNVRVNTLEIGASDVSVFVGWAPGLGAYNLDHPAAEDGVLDRSELDTLTGGDAIGFFVENLDLGLLMMSPVPLALGAGNPDAAAINLILPKLFAMRATADSMGIVGLDDYLELTAQDIVVEINQGSPWVGAVPGMANPVVDWKQSFPDSDDDGPDVDGYEVRTGTTEAAEPMLLDFEGTPLIGVSANAVLLQISDFIHISGSISFRIGPVRTVDIATGLTLATCATATPLLAVPTTASDTDLWRSSDCSMLHNVRVNTIEVGTSGLSVFVGYGPGLSGWSLATDEDGVLSKSEFEDLTGDSDTSDSTYDGDAVGFFLENLTLGMMMMSPVPLLAPYTLLNPLMPKLFSLKADADSLALIGVPGIDLSGTGVRVEVNLGSKIIPSAPLPAAVDWLSSFPDTDGDGTDDDAGFEVATGTSTDPVLLGMQGFLIGGGAENVHIELGEFVYLDGAIYFEYGAIHTVQLADALLPVTDMLTELDLDPTLAGVIGATSKDLSFLNIGAKDLQAFFGVNGPYWVDADGDGEIDRYPEGDPNAGQIVDDETNDDAMGLVIDDLTFGLSFMTPTNLADPSRYIAMVGHANMIGLVGLEDYLVMRAEDLTLELNISTPLLSGFPLLPVVDFAKTFETAPGANDGVFGVKTGARDPVTGEDITVDLGMDGLLIRAGVGFVSLDVMGAITLNGSIGFELGPTTWVTLADGSRKQLHIMTIGASNVYGFVGYQGPYVADSNGNGYIDRGDFETNADGTLGAPKLLNDGTGGRPEAVGFAINDLDLGIFVGLEVETGLGDGPAPSLGVYVAGFLNVGTFGVVGLAGLTAIGTLGASFNVGASTAGGFSAINFETSFPDPGGDITKAGYRVFTGDNDNPILLQFDDFLFKIELAGAINLADTFAVVGIFNLEIDGQGLKLLAAGQMVIGPDLASYDPTTGTISTSSPPIFSINALGALVINSAGIALDFDVDIDLNTGIGIDMSVSARLLINTTGVTQQIRLPDRLYDFLSDQADAGGATGALATSLLGRLALCSGTSDTEARCYSIDGRAPSIVTAASINALLDGTSTGLVYLEPAGAYVVAAIRGSFNFLGFASGTGVAGVGISAGKFQLYFDLAFSLGTAGITIDFGAKGMVDIDSTGVLVHLEVKIDADISSLFHLDVHGFLDINTKGSNDYFRLALSGRVDIGGVVSVSGGISVVVDHGAWRVDIPESTALTGVFGPLTIRAWGFIKSNGEFDVNLSASVHLGVDGFSISGTLSAGVSLTIEPLDPLVPLGPTGYHFRFYVEGSVDIELFGIGIGGSIGLYGDAFLGGTNSFLRLRLRACVDLFFFDACGSTTIAEIQLPSSILPQQPPKLAQYRTGDSGALELNVGDFGTRRTVGTGVTAEPYRVTQVSYDAGTGYYTVRVEAFGYSEVFSRVTSIVGDFGGDDDTFVLVTGAATPVTISGGAGNDVLSSQGSGAATLNGNAGNDTLIGGSGADSLDGGDGDDYLDGRGGLDTMRGGAGDDILYGTLVNLLGETMVGGSGNDIVEVGGTNSADHFVVSVTSDSKLQISTTGGLTGSVSVDGAEDLRISPRGGADTVTLNGALDAAGIDTIKLVMSGEGGTDGADQVTMNLLGGDDVVEVTGSQTAAIASVFRGDGVTGMDYSFTDADPVPTTTMAWNGHYSVVVSDSGLANADRLTIAAGAGNDKVQVRSLASNLEVQGEAGDDRVAVGSSATSTTNTAGTLEGVTGALAVVGGTGTDTLSVDDSGETAGQTGTLTSGLLTGFGLSTAGIAYSETEVVGAHLGGGGDTMNVQSTASVATTTIDAGGGADTFNLSTDAPTNVGNLNSIAGALTILGGGAADTANLSDRSDGGVSDTGTLAYDTLTGYSPAVITYQQIETLNLDLGAGASNLTIVSPGAGAVNVNSGSNDDTVTVTSVASGTTVTVNGEDTRDVIVVNSNDGTLIINGNGGDDDITIVNSAGTLIVNGDAGADFVKILALTGTGTVNGGTEDDDVVVRNLAGTLTVNGEAGSDWTGVLATALGSSLTVNGGDGDDVFEVGSQAEVGTTSASRRALDESGDVNAVDGAVTVNGDAPGAGDWLYVDDTADDGSGEAGLLTATTITGLGMATGITYGTIEHLEISLGDASTTFNVSSTNAGTDTLLQTGGGADTINVSSDLTLGSTVPSGTGTVDLIAGHLTIQGEAGADTAHVSDAGEQDDNTGHLTATDLTGLDMGAAGITYDTLELLDIDHGAGDDTFIVESTHLTQTTIDGAAGRDAVNIRTIDGHTIVTGGADADTIRVGTLAPAGGGTLDEIDALLELQGNEGADQVVADDTGDAGSNVGVVTSTTIEGLGMTVGSVGTTDATTPSSVVHRISIANAFDGTFTITIGSLTTAPIDFDASADSLRAALLAALAGTPGLDASDIQVTRVLHDLELTYVIGFVGDLGGAAGHHLDPLSADGSGLIGLDDYGVASAGSASSTTGRIVYSGIEDLDLGLGGGVDVLQVLSTHAGTTDVAAGDANDVLLVETIGGTTNLLGEDGDDTLVVNPLQGIPAATNGFGDEALTVDGNEGSDLYVVNIWSQGTSELSIHDSGIDPAGTDRLTINGTDLADTFLVRAGYVAALTNKVDGTFQDAERINYDGTIDAGITINALGGADLVAFDDNSSLTTVNGGDGDDRFQVGQLFGDDPDDADDLLVDTELVTTTRGELSNGVSEATTINGGSGNDQFQIFHNLGVLQLNGDTGDDTFIIRTFLGVDGGTAIDAGLGRDLIDYIWNAPVSIDGGDGFDTVVIIGTEADDEFVITADGVYGAGRFVGFTGVEQLDVDGAEGNDTFTVLSTAPGVLVRIFGGLGSDLINVGGDAHAVYGDDLQGHTGLISHSVESTCSTGAAAGCGAFDGVAVDGVAGEILDDEEALVVVVQGGGGTTVSEAGVADTYLVVLNQAPTAEVRVTVAAPSRSPEAELNRSYSLEVSLDGTHWFDAVTIVFTTTSWATPQTVYVRAHGDLSSEGERSAALQHLVASTDPAYDGLPVNNVVVRIIDDDQAGLVLIESGVDTVVTEAGPKDTYSIALARPPLTAVTVTISGDAQVCVSTATDANPDCGAVTLTFAAGSSAAQTITVRARDDGEVESFHFGYVLTEVGSVVPGSESVASTVTAVNGTRITITSSARFDANALRGYLLRLTSGDGAGQSWAIWGNLASTGGPGAWTTVITVQGFVEIAPDSGDQAYINGYVAPVLDQALTGTITAVDSTGTVVTVGGLSTPLPTLDGGLSGALIRIFNLDGTTEYRRIASNTATTITVDSPWTLTAGQAFSILDLEGVSVPMVPVLVADDDAAGVLITESDGSTNVAEGATDPTVGLLYDTYTVVLTRAPVAGETVTVWITPELSETLDQASGSAGYRTLQQLCVSTTIPSAGATCTDARVALTFTADTWNVAQTVYVWAKPDTVVDGSDLQDFADSAQRLYRIQGPLYVDGGADEHADRTIPEPILLPGESSGPLPLPADEAFDAVEDRQVDTLVVHNEDSVSDDTGTLTSTRLSGLGMGPDQFVGGRFLDGGITYEGLEALRILLGEGDDDLTILSTHAGTTAITGNDGDDRFHIETIDGHTNLAGDGGDDDFLVGTAARTLDDLDALLVVDGGSGSDTLTADDRSDPADDDNLGTLTQTTLTGLEMVGTSLDRLFSLTIGATTSHVTFSITIPGRALPVVLTLPVGFTADELAAALQAAIFPISGTATAPVTGCGLGGVDAVTMALDTPCSQSVYVWQHGADLLIGFQGELHGMAVSLAVTSTDAAGLPAPGTATDLARMDGINYYGLDASERLTILLGSGDDRFNVRGTLAHTELQTSGGDDVVFVSDSADLAGLPDALEHADGSLTSVHDDVLHGHVQVDDLGFDGSLDLIDGDLDIDTGAGSNTLAVSDRDDPDADLGALITDHSIEGFADGDITYTSTGGDLAGQGAWALLHDSGMFGRGVTIHAGTGADSITITSVRGGAISSSPLQMTITTLYANDGDDHVTVTAPAVPGGRLVIHGGDGEDTVDAQGGGAVASLPLIVFGEDGDDTIQGGSGADILFGDHGRVVLFDDGAGYDVVVGGNPAAIPDNVLPGGSSLGQNQPDDHVFETIDVVMSLYEDETDDDDVVRGGDGDDLVVGGVGNDALDGEDDRDIVVGDQAVFTRNASGLTPITRELAGTTLFGGVKADHEADPNMGALPWTITLLDHSTTTPSDLYGDDVAAGGSDQDYVFGQLGNDTLHGDGVLVRAGSGWSIALNGTTSDDGDDHIEGGGGADTIFGGLGQDSIIGGSSDLFGLVTAAMRPDGADTVFGGNGDAVARGATGDAPSHGTDADVILGDNGRIFRIVKANGAFEGFTYDDYAGRKLIPRVTELLDYTPTGDDGYWYVAPGTDGSVPIWRPRTATNIGGGDFLHGEAGDDIVHGATGNDTLFGEAHDDDLYGEAGEDWISGGTGDDGILGDDGRLLTSRNGKTERLYGITTATSQQVIEAVGPAQVATINVTGELHKAVELDQVAVDAGPGATTFDVGANDIVYGGLGNDFIHGGQGEDALSGTEALPLYYTLDPVATLRSLGYLVDSIAGILQWGTVRVGEFLAYDENDPWRKVMVAGPGGTPVDFFLNFLTVDGGGTAGDGKDVIFGDAGNDWIVGGTGQDHLYGGWGDDLLNADDDHDSTAGTTDPLANNVPDAQTTPPSYADIAYGGSGRDIMIGNTGADRLIDWAGEFNSYVVPFSPYGNPTVSRSNAPALRQYLYDLSRSDGADVTARPGSSARNGEPYGELGLVTQEDPFWGDATGSPADPQPGNGKSRRDVRLVEDLSGATVATTTLAAPAPEPAPAPAPAPEPVPVPAPAPDPVPAPAPAPVPAPAPAPVKKGKPAKK